jgi:hypothetical protein
VVKGNSSERLLDTYHAERHPVAARVLRMTMAQTTLTRSDARIDALRETVAELAAMEEPRTRLAAMTHALDIRYDFGEGHPLLGRRVPDLDLVTRSGPTRIFALLHDARPLLLRFGRRPDNPPWTDRVRVVDAEDVDTWELPVVGAVSAPGSVLVRPDGHVAWVGDGTDAGLVEALETWFGR